MRDWYQKLPHSKETLTFVSLNSKCLGILFHITWEAQSHFYNTSKEILVGWRNLFIKSKFKSPESACMPSSGCRALPYRGKRFWKQL